MNTADTAIHASWIIPVVPHDVVLQNHCVVIKDDQILAVIASDKLDEHYQVSQNIELPQHVLIPGLINAHGHAAMSLFRGMSDDLPLMEWLQQHIWPAEQRWVDEDFVKDGTEIAIAEMLRGGTTLFSDMYFFPNQAAEAAHQAGMRAQIVFPVFDMPSAWGRDANEYIHKGLEVRDAFKSSRYVEVGFGPHAPYTVGDEALGKIAMYAAELDAPVHIHLHETAHEVNDATAAGGLRPIQRIHKLGLLTPRTQCVHMTELNDEDIELLVMSGAHVIHCPESNLKLASGFCPSQQLLDLGINVAIGTDSASSNNDLNMFSEMRTAALIGKVVSGNAAAISAETVLRMATINAATAMGLQDNLGSLEPGKQADIVAVDLSDIECQPLYCPHSQLVYTESGHRVQHVWIAGKQVLKNRQTCTLNQAELIEKAQYWQQKLSQTQAYDKR